MTATTTRPPMTTEERLVHMPTPGAGLIPLCGWKRGFTLTHFDLAEVTCDACFAEAMRLGMDEDA